jgi:rhodanese-related sulfurtransferase
MIGEIDAVELKDKLDKKDDLILVDVREQQEWDEGHIPSAIFIPLSQFEQEFEKHLKNPDAEVVVQCRSGKRSLDACQRLLGEGFTNLKNMKGGILAWMDEGYPIEK